jgi:hypothetical protein
MRADGLRRDVELNFAREVIFLVTMVRIDVTMMICAFAPE